MGNETEKEELKDFQRKELWKEVQRSREQQLREKNLQKEELSKVEAAEFAKSQETLEKQLLVEIDEKRRKQEEILAT